MNGPASVPWMSEQQRKKHNTCPTAMMVLMTLNGGLLPEFILELLGSGSVYPSQLRLPLCYLQPMPEAPSKDFSLQNQSLCGLVQQLCPVHDI